MVPETSVASGADPTEQASVPEEFDVFVSFQPGPWAHGEGRGQPGGIMGMSALPEYSSTSFTSKMVMTFPLRWLTSTSPSMDWMEEIFAVTSPSLASTLTTFSLNHSRAHSETSLLTQCQLLGLWRTIVAERRRVQFPCGREVFSDADVLVSSRFWQNNAIERAENIVQ